MKAVFLFVIVLLAGFSSGAQVPPAITSGNPSGSDSVFIRTPNGDLVYLGMGPMSLEAMVAREEKDLPATYADGDDYNLYFDGSEKMANAMVRITSAHEDLGWIIGNVILIKRDTGELADLRLGDIIEISRRVAGCKEMKSFLKTANQ